MIISKYIINLDELDLSFDIKSHKLIEGLTNEGKKVLFYAIESYFAKSIPTEEDIAEYINTYYKELVESLTVSKCFKFEFYKECV